MVSLIRVSYKALMRVTKNLDQRIAPILAGILSGLWLRVDPSQFRRRFLSFFVFGRACDILLNKLCQNAYDDPKNVMKIEGTASPANSKKVAVWFIFLCCMSLNQYVQSFEPEINDPLFNKWGNMFSKCSSNDCQMLKV